MAEQESSKAPWWLSIALSLAITLGGWVANASALSTRTSDMGDRLSKLESRYDKEVVPRSEHEARNKGLDAEIARLELRLDSMQQLLESISRDVNYGNKSRSTQGGSK